MLPKGEDDIDRLQRMALVKPAANPPQPKEGK
jgi:hypothetical protein